MRTLIVAILLLVSASTAAQAAHQVTLACTPGTGATPATGFNFYRTLTSGTGYIKLNLTPVTSCAYTDPSPASGTTYFYAVTGVNAVGESFKSTEAKAVIPPDPTVPNPPTSLTCHIDTTTSPPSASCTVP